MRTITLVGACAVIALTAGCGGSTTPRSPTATATAPPQSTASAPAQWTMPNLVGANLQDAQDQIQALTGNPVFLTSSHDLTGQDRHQVLDRNWQVCTQNVAPGTALTSEARLDFGVVKLEETCP